MNHSIPSSLAPAYRQCQHQAFRHYENFPVASLLLAKDLRPHVAALYAFARTADDFADEPPKSVSKTRDGLPPTRAKKAVQKWRFKSLNQWEKQFKKALVDKPAPPILQAFAHTVKTFKIPTNLPLDLLRAFQMDVTDHRYPTWKSLLDYCRLSANPVGRMVLILHGYQDEKLHRYSDYLCTGLQLINFWQDSSVDLARGRIYYPKEAIKKARAKEADLLALKESLRVRKLVQVAVDYTEAHFQNGFPLLEAVSGRLKWELRATYLGGLGILQKIRGMDYNVTRQRPVLNPAEKMLLVLKSIFSHAPR